MREGFSIKHAVKGKHIQKKSKNNNCSMIAKFIAPAVQLILSIVFVVSIAQTGFIPEKYLFVISAVLVLIALLIILLQFNNKKSVFIVSTAFSVIISVIISIILYFFVLGNSSLANITGADYEIDSMVVVVDKNDKAESILDAKDYKFGVQTRNSVDNNTEMIEEIEDVVKTEISVNEYGSVIDLVEAMLAGDIDAAIYSEGFDQTLIDEIENYESKVKSIYKHGIKVEIPQATPKPTPEPTPEPSEPEVSEPESYIPDEKTFNIYLSGVDTKGEIAMKSRSDVNIIVSVNLETKKILLTTTPRDFYVKLPGVSGDSYDKLTHAGNYGIDVSMATLGQVYDTHIDYFAKVNFTSVVELIDGIGGLDVVSEVAFTTTECTSLIPFTFVQGVNHVDGERALAFCRERAAFSAGDVQRGKNQQAVITALIKKLLTAEMLTKFDSLFSVLEDNVQTSMTYDQIAQLVKMQLNDMAEWEIKSVSATATPGSDYCYSLSSSKKYSVMYPNKESVAEITQQIKDIVGE